MKEMISNQNYTITAGFDTFNRDMLSATIEKYNNLDAAYQAKITHNFCIKFDLHDYEYINLLAQKDSWTTEQCISFKDDVSYYSGLIEKAPIEKGSIQTHIDTSEFGTFDLYMLIVQIDFYNNLPLKFQKELKQRFQLKYQISDNVFQKMYARKSPWSYEHYNDFRSAVQYYKDKARLNK